MVLLVENILTNNLKNNTMIIITCIAVYVISAILFWLHVHISNNKGGIYKYDSPTKFDVWCMFTPILNTLLLLLWVFDFPFIIKDNYIKKFFMIKDK